MTYPEVQYKRAATFGDYLEGFGEGLRDTSLRTVKNVANIPTHLAQIPSSLVQLGGMGLYGVGAGYNKLTGSEGDNWFTIGGTKTIDAMNKVNDGIAWLNPVNHTNAFDPKYLTEKQLFLTDAADSIAEAAGMGAITGGASAIRSGMKGGMSFVEALQAAKPAAVASAKTWMLGDPFYQVANYGIEKGVNKYMVTPKLREAGYTDEQIAALLDGAEDLAPDNIPGVREAKELGYSDKQILAYFNGEDPGEPENSPQPRAEPPAGYKKETAYDKAKQFLSDHKQGLVSGAAGLTGLLGTHYLTGKSKFIRRNKPLRFLLDAAGGLGSGYLAWKAMNKK